MIMLWFARKAGFLEEKEVRRYEEMSQKGMK